MGYKNSLDDRTWALLRRCRPALTGLANMAASLKAKREEDRALALMKEIDELLHEADPLDNRFRTKHRNSYRRVGAPPIG